VRISHRWWAAPGVAAIRLTALVDELIGRVHEVHVNTRKSPRPGRTRPGPAGEYLWPALEVPGTGMGVARALRPVRSGAAAFWRARSLRAHIDVHPPPTPGRAASLGGGKKAVNDNLATLPRESGARRVMVRPFGTDLAVFPPHGPGSGDAWRRTIPCFVFAGDYGAAR
jgi:hypothetical protein